MGKKTDVEIAGYLFDTYKNKNGNGCFVYRHGTLCSHLSTNFCQTKEEALANAVWLACAEYVEKNTRPHA